MYELFQLLRTNHLQGRITFTVMKINRSFLELNLAIIFLSTSGVLGRPILMTPTLTIWWRCAIAMVVMLGFAKWMKYDLKIRERSHYRIIFLSSFLLAVHWVSYFYSLSLSNIAIALITLHTFPTMTAILEPIILKTKFRLYHIGLSLMIIIGLYIIVPKSEAGQHIIPGIIAGLISALTYALRNIYTRKVIADYNGSVMMLFQLIIMTVLLTPFLITESNATFHIDWPFLLGVAIITTCFGHTLFVKNLKNYTASTISLLVSIVPIYGILWGVIFLDEIPGMNVILGGMIILAAFVIESRRSN